MAAKIEKNKVGQLASKAFYSLLKTSLEDEAIYAGVSYFPDSDWNVYSGSTDSESTFWGGSDSDYGSLDKTYYDQTMYSMHKVLPGGISRVVPRQDWTYGITYRPDIIEKSYVLVKEYISGYLSLNVYKCLFSPLNASTYPPTGTGSTPIQLSDGYTWKFLYTITNSQSLRFLNDKWMPVAERIGSSEYSNMTTDSIKYNQYISQINAEQGTVFDVTLDSDSLWLSINADSDLRVAFNNDNVNLIGLDNRTNTPSRTMRMNLKWDTANQKFTKTLTQYGQGYIGPVTIRMDSDSLPINGLAGIVAPGEGHGANVPSEMQTNNVMVSVRVAPDEQNKAVYNYSPYNMVTLHLNPVDLSTGLIATNEFYITCNSFSTDTTSSFSVGEIIRPYYNDDGRRGYIISHTDGIVYYISTVQGNEFDSFLDSEVVSLESGNKINYIKKTNDREIVFDSSDLLVADYRSTEIIRNEGQIETFNFILSF